MIQTKTNLKLADNSGAKICVCIKLYKTCYAAVGSIILVSIKAIKSQSKLKKGDLYKAVVVRRAFKTRRSNNMFMSFNDNAVVLLNKKNDLISSRVLGPIGIEIRRHSLVKLLSLSSFII